MASFIEQADNFAAPWQGSVYRLLSPVSGWLAERLLKHFLLKLKGTRILRRHYRFDLSHYIPAQSWLALTARTVPLHGARCEPGTLVLPVADHKRVKTYTFAIKGRSTIETPAGRFDAVQFERIDDPKTTLRFWLAPARDYMPVKVQNIEDGEDKVSLTLKKGS